MSELRGLGAVHQVLVKRGGKLIAVCVDPPAKNREVIEKHKLPFSILSDEDRAVTKRYGLLHAKGAPDGADVAIPAHFLIDTRGRIIWEHIATTISDRPDPADELRMIRTKL